MTGEQQGRRLVSHPFQVLSDRQQHAALAASLAVALLVRQQMRVRAKTRTAPHGTLSFALAGAVAKARTIRQSWRPRTRRQVNHNLHLDPLFSLAWTNAIALACVAAASALRSRGWPGAGFGAVLAWGQAGAALLAAGKDVALLALLRGRGQPPLAQVERWAAVVEISLKGLGIAYAAAGGAAWLADRLDVARHGDDAAGREEPAGALRRPCSPPDATPPRPSGHQAPARPRTSTA